MENENKDVLPPVQILDLARRCGIKATEAALVEFAALVRGAEPLAPEEMRPVPVTDTLQSGAESAPTDKLTDKEIGALWIDNMRIAHATNRTLAFARAVERAALARRATAPHAAEKAPSGPNLYRKTALVHAEQFLPSEGKIPAGVISDGNGDPRKDARFSFVLQTLEGVHQLRDGDYICTGPKGEKWNVERSIFESTYEPAAQPVLPAVGSALVARADKFEEIRALLNETHQFASTSPVGKQNISAALDLLDGIEESATGALVAVKDEQHPDDLAVDRFAAAMKEKMVKSRAKGRGGWDDPEQCSVERLQNMLLDHLAKGDPVDIGNFAMMLFNRGGRVAAPTESAAAPADLIALAVRDVCELDYSGEDHIHDNLLSVTVEDLSLILNRHFATHQPTTQAEGK